MKYKIYHQYGGGLSKVKSGRGIKSQYSSITEAQKAIDILYKNYYDTISDILIIRQFIDVDGSQSTQNIVSIKTHDSGWINFLIKDDVL